MRNIGFLREEGDSIMNSDMISDELCELDLDVSNTDEFFQIISERAKYLGYITDDF